MNDQPSISAEERNEDECALLRQRRGDLLAHYYECRRRHPNNTDVDLIDQ